MKNYGSITLNPKVVHLNPSLFVSQLTSSQSRETRPSRYLPSISLLPISVGSTNCHTRSVIVVHTRFLVVVVAVVPRSIFTICNLGWICMTTSLRDPDLRSLDTKLFTKFTKNTHNFWLFVTGTWICESSLSDPNIGRGSKKTTHSRGPEVRKETFDPYCYYGWSAPTTHQSYYSITHISWI